MASSKDSTILVTGGAGYVGSHACKALARAGYTPVVYDNLERGHEHNVKWGRLERGDILDVARLRSVFAQHRPRAVMHFAALAYVSESVEQPLRYYENNVTGSLNLIAEATRAGTECFVFSSTCATYGVPKQVPIAEDQAQEPISPYGMSKLIVERMLDDAERASKLRSVKLRYFNAAGDDPDGEIGEEHEPETHLIPNVMRTALKRQPVFTVFGTDYPTDDGTCVRDFVHVSDLAEAHVLALSWLLEGKPSRAFNLASKEGASVRQILNLAREITGEPIPEQVGPRRPSEPAVLIGDAARARAELGWQPKHSDLGTIIRTAWEWHRRH